MMTRPTIARPAQGMYFPSPRNYSPTKESHSPIDRAPLRSPYQAKFPQQDKMQMDQQMDSYLPSHEDEYIVCELERLADERNIPEILKNGYLNGSSCIRLSLSPRGVLRDSTVGDFDGNLNLGSYSQNSSLMDRFKRKNPRGALIITSDD